MKSTVETAAMHRFVGLPVIVSALLIGLPCVCQQPPAERAPLTPNDDEAAAHLIGELPVIRADFSKATELESIGVIPVQVRVNERGIVTTAELEGNSDDDAEDLPKSQREVLAAIVADVKKAAMSVQFRPFEQDGQAEAAEFEIEIPIRSLEDSARHVPFPRIRDLKSVRMSLSRSGCLGRCPSYKIEVHGDGTVLYDGGMYVAIQGQHRATVSADTISQLLDAFREADYFSLKDKYVWGATDLPTYITSLSVDGKMKTVVDYAGAQVGMPETVSKLEETIDSLSGAERWTKGNAETVPALLHEQFDFHSAIASDILTNVTQMGTADAVRDLIAAGVPISSKPIQTRFLDPSTPFGNAAFRGDVEMLNALVGAGINDTQALTDALGRAASAGKLDAMRLLIQHGANPTSPPVLTGAASSGVPDAVLEILRHRPDVNARDHDNATALIAALQAYHYKDPGVDLKEVIRILLDAGADPNLANDKGETPLMLNARDLGIAEMLVAHGANVNTPAKDGFTPLLNAETLELTRFLLKNGADPFAKDDHGETALDWAKKMNRKDQAVLLQAAMEHRKD